MSDATTVPGNVSRQFVSDSVNRPAHRLRNHNDLHVGFIDRNSLATWVRLHPSLILWVRNKIARPLEGWHPYGNWSHSPAGNSEYILDEGIRLHDTGEKKGADFSILDGIIKFREILSVPGTSIRLAGLSGVGKTRFVQALFDLTIGNHALDPSFAFYADAGSGASPKPRIMIEQLIAAQARAIVIVDNCPPALHRDLTLPCTTSGSTVSVITIEYDVRDDLPDETNVFRLQPASEPVIEKIIEERFSSIGQVNRLAIAKFSGGNARLAIALARTVEADETLTSLRDNILFERLFQQRNSSNDNLLKAAMALSLLYSFDGVNVSSADSELNILGSLIDKKGSELYGDVDIIIKRDLIQSRGMWRAILPHAVANYLAKRALESFPKNLIVQTFLSNGSQRLIKSFSRRLSYLHDAAIAQEIARDWLQADGYVGQHVGNFNEFGMDVFKNVASILPESALESMERVANGENGAQFTSRDNKQFAQYVRLLRLIAYEDHLFKRSADLLVRFALTESVDERNDPIRDVLKSLFYICLSGTHAPLNIRKAFIENLLFDRTSLERQNLGLLLLDSALETSHFSSHHDFQFGARPRDYGYHPKDRGEITNWFEVFTSMCVCASLSGLPIADRAKDVLRKNFRGLWVIAGIFSVLETGMKATL